MPEVFIRSEDNIYYLQEDLGDTLLFNAIEKGRKTSVFDEEEKQLLRKTMRLLPAVQFAGADGMDFSYCYPQAEFNSRSILWDLNYFKYCFLKATGMDFQEDRLEDDFQKMADVLLRSSSATFMYRDFQSRNVMIKDGEPWLIDFQGGRKGPVYYDVASFLWQAKANYPDSLRQELLKEYIEALRKYQPVDESYFYAQLRHFVLFRTMQVLGAYGFRGYFEKKPHFIQSVPFAIENLRQLLQEPYPEYPYLCKVLHRLTELKQFTDDLKKRRLVVKVTSFAYKKGIPEDSSGNGGGFVFDCRAVNNPGKYERYKLSPVSTNPLSASLKRMGKSPYSSNTYMAGRCIRETVYGTGIYQPVRMFRLYRRPTPLRIFGPTPCRTPQQEVRRTSEPDTQRTEHRTEF